MRLKAINVYSSSLEDTTATRKRTVFLRSEADFLDYELRQSVKYINNSYCKQLNISCSEHADSITIGKDAGFGYPQIEIPFHFNDYCTQTDYERKLFWINALRDIFSILIAQYEFDAEKTEEYLKHLDYTKAGFFGRRAQVLQEECLFSGTQKVEAVKAQK